MERENSNEDDAREYVEGKIGEIKKHVEVLFLGEQEIAKKLNQNIAETKYFITRYEMPGVVTRWKQINP